MDYKIGERIELIYEKISEFNYQISWDLPLISKRIYLPEEDRPVVTIVGYNYFNSISHPFTAKHTDSKYEFCVGVTPISVSKYICEPECFWNDYYLQSSVKLFERIDKNLALNLDQSTWFSFILEECIVKNSYSDKLFNTCRRCFGPVKTTDKGICYSCWSKDHFKKFGI